MLYIILHINKSADLNSGIIRVETCYRIALSFFHRYKRYTFHSLVAVAIEF